MKQRFLTKLFHLHKSWQLPITSDKKCQVMFDRLAATAIKKIILPRRQQQLKEESFKTRPRRMSKLRSLLSICVSSKQ